MLCLLCVWCIAGRLPCNRCFQPHDFHTHYFSLSPWAWLSSESSAVTSCASYSRLGAFRRCRISSFLGSADRRPCSACWPPSGPGKVGLHEEKSSGPSCRELPWSRHQPCSAHRQSTSRGHWVSLNCHPLVRGCGG